MSQHSSPSTDTDPSDGPDAAADNSGADKGFVGLLRRLDELSYQFEAGIVTGGLMVMVFTWVLKILDRDMRAETTGFDVFLIELSGYADVGAAPPELIAQVTGFWSPLVLSGACYLLCVLAFRTRDLMGSHGQEPTPLTREMRKKWWWKALIATAGIYFLLKLVQWVPPVYLCTVALLAMMIPSAKWARSSKEWGTFAGVVVGGGWLLSFFLEHAGDDYIWVSKFSLVLLMYVGFLGASMATRDKRHLGIEAVRKLVPRRFLHIYNALGNGFTALFTAFLFVLAFRYHMEFLSLNADVPGLDLGVTAMTLPITAALGVMTLRFLAVAVTDMMAWRRGDEPADLTPEVH